MDNKIESTYVIKIDEVLRNLRTVDDTIGNVDDAINKTGKNQSFGTLAQSVQNFNAILADGSKVYRQLETGAKSYQAEINRLKTAEISLIKTQAEFKNSMEYDKAEKNLVAVRARINELNQAIANTADTTKEAVDKSDNLFERFGKKVKSVAIAVAAYFTVDALISLEGSIVQATSSYEKYFAVLRNGFQDENKATESLALIYDFASNTPFAVTELTESFIKLTNRGFTPTLVELTKLGDLASSQGKSFNQLTEAILDAMTGEFERLKEFGIKSKTVGDNVTLAFKGQEVTVNKFNQGALKEAVLGFGALQGVAGSMGAVALTLEGKISNLGDSFNQLLVSLGRSQGFLGGTISLVTSLVNAVKSFMDVPVEKKLQQENAELNALGGALILANNNQSVRNSLLTEIGQKYPSFLALLGKEADNTYAIRDALALVNEQYRIKIRLAGQDVLAKRNAEKEADIIEATTVALKNADNALKSIGSSAVQFQTSSFEQQQKIIQQVKDRTKDTGVTGGGFGGTVLQSGLKEKAVAPFQVLLDLSKKVNDNELQGVAIQTERARLTSLGTLANIKAIESKKAENLILVKNLIAEKEYKDILKIKEELRSNGMKEEIAIYQRFQANKEQIETFAKQGKTDDATSKTQNGKTAKPKGADVSDEVAKLLKAETDYQDKLNKIRLDSANVRLSLLDKDSQKYLNEKLAYDLQVLDSEKEAFKKLYEVELAQILLREKLKDRKGKISKDELEALKKSTEEEAKVLARGPGPRSFDNSTDTAPQRDLISIKSDVIKAQFGENRNRLEDKLNKKRIDDLDLQNSLLGEGLDKQIAIIISKYAKLIEANQKNADTIKVLEAKRTEEILNATFKKDDKNVDSTLANKKEQIKNRTQSGGQSSFDFDIKNKKDLLDAEKVFFDEKIRLLEKYLSDVENKNLVGLGVVSSAEIKSYEDRLKSLKDSQQKANQATQHYVDINALSATRYMSEWDKVSAVFKLLTGKAIQFSEDPELDKAIKDAIQNTLSSLKDSLSESLALEIEQSDKKIALLENEISKKQSVVDSEKENFKLGLANNYLEEKKNLEDKKKERDNEIVHKKKLQKEQAGIDAALAASSGALSAILMVEATVRVFNAHGGIPFVGVLLALASIATIIATVANVKSKFKSSQLKYGGKITGNMHEFGQGIPVGDTGISVEGDEFVTRRDVVAKNPDLFESLNSSDFATLSANKQSEMLKPFGLKQIENVSLHVKQGLSQQARIEYFNQRNIERHYENMNKNIGNIASNTSRIPSHQIVANDKETLKFTPNGRLVEIIKNNE